MKKKAIVIAGSRGIGRGIAEKLKKLKFDVITTNKKSLDTSNISEVKKFIRKHKSTDILVLNTGGPPPKSFEKITEEEWTLYYNQLFLSFVLMLQKIKVKKNGFVFLISSFYIKEPSDNLVLSNSFRVALSSVLKSYGQKNLMKNISTLNLALGPIYTDRLKELNPNKSKKEIGKDLPMGRVGEVGEIASFVESIIKKNIKYLNSQTIFFDGGISKTIF